MENVFKNKNFILIFLGALVSNIVNLFYSFAVGYWILDITNNNAIIQGTYLGVCGLTYVVFSLFGGVFSDRFNKAKIMYICDYLKAILIIVSAIAILLFEGNVTICLVILFSMGIIGNIIASMFAPASTSILPLILKEEQLQQANSYMSVLHSLQSIVGLFIAGILYSSMHITTLFFIVGGCYLISAISEMFIKYDYKPKEEKLTLSSTYNDIKEGFLYVKTKKALVSLLAIIVLCNFFLSPITSNFISYFVKTDVATNPNYLLKDLLSPEMWGAMFSIGVSITSIIFGIVLSTKSLSENAGKGIKKWLFIFSLIILLTSISYIVFVDFNDLLNVFLVILFVSALLIGMSLSYVNIPISTSILTITDKDKLGKVSSITNLISQGLVPLSTFIAGFVIAYTSSSVLLIICSIGLLVVSIISLCNKSIDNLK